MANTFNLAQLEQFEQVIEKVLDKKLGEDYMDRIDRIENNTDAACKIASDTQQEQVFTQDKVDRHDTEIKSLQNFAGFATA